MKVFIQLVGLFYCFLIMTGCMANSKQMIIENTQQLEVRSYQTKTYETSKNIAARACVAALQDLSFIIDKADMETGTLSATKLDKNANLKMTIVVRANGTKQAIVRANAQFSSSMQMPASVDDPEVYQRFFEVLDKAIFFEEKGIN
ncbi:hypothetical protein [Campylobacter cuniculorum]|uniref:Lipoprotein n=2 Tax=Campylobacter cuniculorum TaxID=374106 RepID=A0A1W6BXA3_9BACT|nr:hypothetical protein [Campylobacter cuniculorum]ARJ56714.1 hypothetical protein CCUN_1117 [Campylobacter cuniculorum DSM 23162 = LMG 24588]QOR04185.1 hypothetical protein A0071_08485 [Campylobacter cuniculorum]